MGKKQVIRLTESDIHNIVKEAVNNILIKEDIYSDQWEYEIRMFFDGLKNGEATTKTIRGSYIIRKAIKRLPTTIFRRNTAGILKTAN